MSTVRVESGDIRVLLTESIHHNAVDLFSSAGYNVATRDAALDEETLAKELVGVHVLGIRSTTQVTEAVLDNAPDLLAVGAFCIGTNQIDLSAASRRGVAVFNAPFSNTRSVVELALGEIILLTRRIVGKSEGMHAGRWDKSSSGSHEIRGRSLGIVGYGNIGSQLSVLAESLGMSVSFYDTQDKLALGNARRCDSLEELLERSDVVTLHVDGRPSNTNLFGEAQFDLMRPGSIFLNLSRGFVVDHMALRRHILSGHLGGAAIDVFPTEPKRRGDPFVSDLRGLDNVILTPHIGGSTMEAQVSIGNFVSAKLRDYLLSGSTALSVNLPSLALAGEPDVHRLAHIHRNTPGVLAKINGILAEHGVNIEGQYLGTRSDVGYVLTDIGAMVDQSALEALDGMPETIRLRLLS